MLAALRGPRRGEIAGLRWEDIDLFAGELTIREQVIVIDGVEHLGPPKSAAGVRVLALDEVSVQILWAAPARPRRSRRLPAHPPRLMPAFVHGSLRVLEKDGSGPDVSQCGREGFNIGVRGVGSQREETLDIHADECAGGELGIES